MPCDLFEVRDNPLVEYRDGQLKRRRYYCKNNTLIDSETGLRTKYRCADRGNEGADLFHGTRSEMLPAIAKNGLRPRGKNAQAQFWFLPYDEESIYLADEPECAIVWGLRDSIFSSAVLEEKIALLRIPNALYDDALNLKEDVCGSAESILSGTCFMSKNAISPDKIELLTQDGWKPIKGCYQ